MARQPTVDPSWKNLAELLLKRRVDLDPRYRNRRVFCSEKEIEYRVISDIEGARRTNFSAPMITAIEVAYEIADGAIRDALTDPDMRQLPERVPRRPGLQNGDSSRTGAIVPDGVSLPDLPEWEQHIWLTPGITVRERETAILLIRLYRGDLNDDTRALLALSHALNQVVARHLAGEQNPPQAS